MFVFNEILVNVVRYVFPILSPVLIIGLVVAFIMHVSSDKKEDNTPSNAAANVLLYIGSFFIFLSFIFLLRESPDVLPPLLMTSSVLIYIGGLVLYKTVKYLKPVALAFTYTALALFPFWVYAFSLLHITDSLSIFLSVTVSLLAYIGAAIVTRSKIAGWLSYLWIILFGWTAANVIAPATFPIYAFFLWPLIVAVFPAYCWGSKVKWLPVAFRAATKALSYVLVPAVAVIALLTLPTISNIASDYPALRASVFGLATFVAFIQWLIEHSFHKTVIIRLCAQGFLIMLVADLMNYSINSNSSHEASVAMAIIWLVSSLLQAIVALAMPHKEDPAINKSNNAILVASIIGILSTSVFCHDFPSTEYGIISIVICAIVAILSVAITYRYRNIHWGIAGAIAMTAIPYIICNSLLGKSVEGYVPTLMYVGLNALFLLGYFFIRDKQPSRSFFVICFALVFSNLASYSICGYGYASLCLFIAAAEFAMLSGVSRKLTLLEPALYVAAVAGCFYIQQLSDLTGWNGRDAQLGIRLIQYNLIGLPMIAVGFYKRAKNPKEIVRIILGYIALSLGTLNLMPTIGHYVQSDSLSVWTIIGLVEQVILVIIGAVCHLRWMLISASIVSVCLALSLTGGPNYLWLAIIGMALIVAVIVILAKNNQKQAESGKQKPKSETK